MTLTQKEEQVLKAEVVVKIAKAKLNKENQIMGDKIRAQFDIIDKAIRLEHKAAYEALQLELKTAEDNFNIVVE